MRQEHQPPRERTRRGDVVRQAAIVVLTLALCPAVALAAPDDPSAAFARANEIVAMERSLGLFVEPRMHACRSGPRC